MEGSLSSWGHRGVPGGQQGHPTDKREGWVLVPGCGKP